MSIYLICLLVVLIVVCDKATTVTVVVTVVVSYHGFVRSVSGQALVQLHLCEL